MKNARIFPMLFAAILSGGSISGSKNPAGSGLIMGGYSPFFIPRRKKFKGYMRENRRFKNIR